MKWFRHETDAKDSEKIAVLIDGYGFEGYGRFWRICEIIADRMDETDRCYAELPESIWCQKLAITRPKLRQYLTDVASIFDIKVTLNEHRINIEYRKLLQKRDNYTKDLQASSKRLPSIDRDTDTDTELDKTRALNPNPAINNNPALTYEQNIRGHFFANGKFRNRKEYQTNEEIEQAFKGKISDDVLAEMIRRNTEKLKTAKGKK